MDENVVPKTYLKTYKKIGNEKMAAKDRNFLALLIGIFGIFLLWSAFTVFQQINTYNAVVLIGSILGIILIVAAWKAIS